MLVSSGGEVTSAIPWALQKGRRKSEENHWLKNSGEDTVK